MKHRRNALSPERRSDNSPGQAQRSPGSEFKKSPRPVGTLRNPSKMRFSIKSPICNPGGVLFLSRNRPISRSSCSTAANKAPGSETPRLTPPMQSIEPLTQFPEIARGSSIAFSRSAKQIMNIVLKPITLSAIPAHNTCVSSRSNSAMPTRIESALEWRCRILKLENSCSTYL